MQKRNETGRARIGRLVRETPGCKSCGCRTDVTFRREGKTIYACRQCLPYLK